MMTQSQETVSFRVTGWPNPMTRTSGYRQILTGDIVITAVGEHYAMGRKVANSTTLEFLGSHRECIDALNAGCRLAGALHRVVLYPNASFPAIDLFIETVLTCDH